MLDQTLLSRQIENDGYATRESIVSQQEVDQLINSVEREQAGQAVERSGKIFAVRNLLDSPEIRKLAQSKSVLELARTILGSGAFPVRGILFDKIPEANWKVPWHQDVTIAVRDRTEVDGFAPWSTKAGVLHVQAPPSVLENMISIRLHLDACDESNGALQVIPGSHRSGRIPETDIPAAIAESKPQTCAVNRGGALLMRPLLLHASSASQSPAHRRVIHLDFAGRQLPAPLKWLSES
ncbi:MAG: phytanoyl-CoA dioxygenase family protein [Acidobacteria bacterium]|nr:phytanoyl-CoA dioxygenase family protein [Acidobacteriota bacterium]